MLGQDLRLQRLRWQLRYLPVWVLLSKLQLRPGRGLRQRDLSERRELWGLSRRLRLQRFGDLLQLELLQPPMFRQAMRQQRLRGQLRHVFGDAGLQRQWAVCWVWRRRLYRIGNLHDVPGGLWLLGAGGLLQVELLHARSERMWPARPVRHATRWLRGQYGVRPVPGKLALVRSESGKQLLRQHQVRVLRILEVHRSASARARAVANARRVATLCHSRTSRSSRALWVSIKTLGTVEA